MKIKPDVGFTYVFIVGFAVCALPSFFAISFFPALFGRAVDGEFTQVSLFAVGYPFLIWFLINIFFSFIYVAYKIKTYEASQYIFTNDRVDYSESFLNQEEKELTYSRVIEVIHKRNVLQRLFGIGSIILQTQATSYDTKHNTSGIRIPDLLESKKKYNEVKAIVRKANDGK